jgi:hypothetical protein
MLWEVITPIADDRAAGVRLDTRHQGYARTQGRYRNVASETKDVDTVRGWKEEAKAGFHFRITEVN